MEKPGNFYYFEGLSDVVEIVNCDNLLAHFPIIFPGWQIHSIALASEPPVLSLVRKSDGYHLSGISMDEPVIRRDEADVICGFIAELIRITVNSNNQQLCLHGASVVINGRLVVFPSVYRAGKSVLSACLSASGKTLFGDDVLPVDMESGDAVAPGLALRLRLPLPDNLTEAERTFIESRLYLKGKRYGYLSHPEGELAPRGTRLPIGAFVLLQREAGIEAELSSLSESEVLRQVVWQNFAREADAAEILTRLQDLVAESQFYRLRYDRACDAVRLLTEAFEHWETPRRKPSAVESATKSSDIPNHSLTCGAFIRSHGIHVVTLDQEKFLADSAGEAIYHLNMLGGAVWHLLENPHTKVELAEIVSTAFPDVDHKTIQQDVGNILKDLLETNLVIQGS